MNKFHLSFQSGGDAACTRQEVISNTTPSGLFFSRLFASIFVCPRDQKKSLWANWLSCSTRSWTGSTNLKNVTVHSTMWRQLKSRNLTWEPATSFSPTNLPYNDSLENADISWKTIDLNIWCVIDKNFAPSRHRLFFICCWKIQCQNSVPQRRSSTISLVRIF